jgi:hypothetical protein
MKNELDPQTSSEPFYSKGEKKKIKREALQLFKDFSVRKQANVQNVFYSNKGSLDLGKLAEYRTNDNLFKREVKQVSNDVNHKFYFVVDYSASMWGNNIRYAMRQVTVFREFCRMANVEFEVYIFSNSVNSKNYTQNYEDRITRNTGYSEYTIEPYLKLAEISNDTQNDRAFDTILRHVTRNNLNDIKMGSTPLTGSCKIMRLKMEADKRNDPDKKINFVLLTDGGETGSLGQRIILEGNDRQHYTALVGSWLTQLEMIKKTAHSVLGFTLGDIRSDYISLAMKNSHIGEGWADVRKDYSKKMNKEGYVSVQIPGFDEAFVINNKSAQNAWKFEGYDEKSTSKKLANDFMAAQKATIAQKLIAQKVSERIS